MSDENRTITLHLAGDAGFWDTAMTAIQNAVEGEPGTVVWMPQGADYDHEKVASVSIQFHCIAGSPMIPEAAFATWLGEDCPYPQWADALDDA